MPVMVALSIVALSVRRICNGHPGTLRCRQRGGIHSIKFKAVNNRGKNFTKNKMARRMAQIEESVARYLQQLDSADRQEPSLARETKATRLKDKIAVLKKEMQGLATLEIEMLQKPDQQVSLTDPDARSMATSGRGTGMVGYNVQTAVDTKHHLIVAHEVTSTGHGHEQLYSMAGKAKEALKTEHLEVLADRGYFESGQILACEEAGIAVTLPKAHTSNNRLRGMFVKADFRYVPSEDVYVCPAGERLKYYYTNEERGLTLRRYWTNACQACPIKTRCTSGVQRRITRWEHEHVLEAVQQRLDENPQMMRVRRETSEHPFGTLKSWMGATHFLTKTLKKVSSEMALHVLAYNLKRVMNILGPRPLMAAIRA
jgi:hypothetical protein